MRMTRLAKYPLILALTALPAAAQEEGSDMSEGLNLLSEGTRLLLRGLVDEMEPALKELEGLVDDLNAYHPPEVLPNGDIIIRRRTPIDETPEIEPGEEIEL